MPAALPYGTVSKEIKLTFQAKTPPTMGTEGNWTVTKSMRGVALLTPGRDYAKAYEDIVKNPGNYGCGCYEACYVAMLAGGKDMAQIGNVALENATDWIPGDWGYIENKTGVKDSPQEGENVIYCGAGKYYGLYPGKGLETMDGWLAEIKKWGGNTGQPKITGYRTYPSAGLTDAPKWKPPE